MKFGSAEAENSLSLDRATDDCQPVPSLSPPLRVNEWATKILPSSVLRISSATYLTVKSLYLSERIPQRYKFTLRRSAARSPRGGVLSAKKILFALSSSPAARLRAALTSVLASRSVATDSLAGDSNLRFPVLY